ncbi:hypothetical protein B7435_16955 [Mycolicibacterium peregrinum]|uniref:Uncharacterized protein n=1 Tax=Mycolicibacterium alvei TaxID=67081 RepID=A0A6N4V3F4_9MYCO|nr:MULTISPECIES: hypothetical protein [Mycolicibacterium]MCV7003605.1 hypothetical protein [Mycolicibacterium alvei]OWM01250.1 hypothetical protein B7435_16955 [Mycolicibacterium peregrinum]BBX30437.1 hypothetical protein MALV_55620 [Mycolicibacterium alvei]
MMYLVDGEEFPLEMLTAEQTTNVLVELRAQAATVAGSGTLAAQIAELADWLEFLDEEAADEVRAETASDLRVALHAEQYAGIL